MMNQRTLEDYNHERQALDAAHAQNEAGRDAFVALAHTALFAASVSFVGDVAPITRAIWQPALILGWTADVVGLLALTVSFVAARKAIDARRAALNDPSPPDARLCEWLNGIALWSFPLALLCLFSFVTANVVHADGRKDNSAASSKLLAEGCYPTAKSADPRGHIASGQRRDARSASTGTAAASPSTKEVTGNGAS